MFGCEQVEKQDVMYWNRKYWRIKKRGFREKTAKVRIGHVEC